MTAAEALRAPWGARVVRVLEWMLGSTLLLSAGALPFATAPPPGSLALGTFDVSVAALAVVSEAGAAALLLEPRGGRASGVALLLWAGAMAMMRTRFGEANCSCLAVFGSHPIAVMGVWSGVTTCGAFRALRGPWVPGAASAARLAFGVSAVFTSVFWAAVVRAPAATEFLLAVDGVAKDATSANGALAVVSRLSKPMRLVSVSPSCDCVRVEPPEWTTLRPLSVERVRFTMVDRPAWVRPRATVVCELDGRRLERSIDLLPTR